MSRRSSWKIAAAAIVLAAWPIAGSAQTPPPDPSSLQAGAAGQAPPASQPVSVQEVVGPLALQHLNAARDVLADMTKLPAAMRLEGQARTNVNQLIADFNALITSSSAEWKPALDRVQQSLAALLGSSPTADGQTAVGTSGPVAGTLLDPALAGRLLDVRVQVEQFGQAAGAVPQQDAPAPTDPAASAAVEAANDIDQVKRTVDQASALLDRLLAQAPPNSPTVAVSRQNLQQLRQYLDWLRQSIR
jgi:hypothetical protein